MSATRLLVLGVVRSWGRAHGYQVRRELLSWGVEQWASVKPGSIYHALRQLLKTGALRTAGVEESGEGPERTLFEVTEAGEDEFRRLVARALSDGGAKPEVFGAGLVFMTCLPREQVVPLLEHRLHELEAELRSSESLLAPEVLGYKPAHVAELFQWWARSAEASVRFNRELLDRVRGGAYTMAGEPGAAFGEPPAGGPPAGEPERA
ncbi:PadR family transcriptional regulator [Nocardiopsis potens]|uniref:PadR family transcriptional regulator n=1 Tax=Nocardiopsis potens TaxID=1246458 RepID=UPI000349FFFE|nr:helix-turn-helix transcriptional regulator [Nocardiopsis potens]